MRDGPRESPLVLSLDLATLPQNKKRGKTSSRPNKNTWCKATNTINY